MRFCEAIQRLNRCLKEKGNSCVVDDSASTTHNQPASFTKNNNNPSFNKSRSNETLFCLWWLLKFLWLLLWLMMKDDDRNIPSLLFSRQLQHHEPPCLLTAEGWIDDERVKQTNTQGRRRRRQRPGIES